MHFGHQSRRASGGFIPSQPKPLAPRPEHQQARLAAAAERTPALADRSSSAPPRMRANGKRDVYDAEMALRAAAQARANYDDDSEKFVTSWRRTSMFNSFDEMGARERERREADAAAATDVGKRPSPAHVARKSPARAGARAGARAATPERAAAGRVATEGFRWASGLRDSAADDGRGRRSAPRAAAAAPPPSARRRDVYDEEMALRAAALAVHEGDADDRAHEAFVTRWRRSSMFNSFDEMGARERERGARPPGADGAGAGEVGAPGRTDGVAVPPIEGGRRWTDVRKASEKASQRTFLHSDQEIPQSVVPIAARMDRLDA